MPRIHPPPPVHPIQQVPQPGIPKKFITITACPECPYAKRESHADVHHCDHPVMMARKPYAKDRRVPEHAIWTECPL